MKDNFSVFMIFLSVGFFLGAFLGFIFVTFQDHRDIDCIGMVKDSYDITDFNKNELESKIAACNLLYTEGN